MGRTWGARARSLWTARRSERACSATAHGRLYMEFDIRQTKYFLARGCIQRKQRRKPLFVELVATHLSDQADFLVVRAGRRCNGRRQRHSGPQRAVTAPLPPIGGG